MEMNALLWTAFVALLSHNLVVPVVSSAGFFEDQKNYYTPDPNAQPPPVVTYTPPPVTYTPPPYSSGGGHAGSPPSHGTPPSHGGGSGTPPSHGGGSYGGSPPANCGTPPSGGGGGHHHTSPPSGGGYHHSPPSSTPTPTTPTPTTPYTPTPSTPTTPTVGTPPTTPTVGTPPTTPIDPGTPAVPSPPFSFDPNSPPFSCNYWRNHPQLIWALYGWLGNIGTAMGGTIGSTGTGLGTGTGFGTGTGTGTGGSTPTPITGANMNFLQALSNTRSDGYGALYREGTAALLNSMAHTRFPYTTEQVRDSFVRSLSSNRAAAAQAQLFKMANEGRMRPRD